MSLHGTQTRTSFRVEENKVSNPTELFIKHPIIPKLSVDIVGVLLVLFHLNFAIIRVSGPIDNQPFITIT